MLLPCTLSLRTSLSPPSLKPLSLSSFSSLPSSPQPPSDDGTLVSTAVSILTNQRSKSRWSHLRSLFLSHGGGPLPSHISQITLSLRNNPHLALRFFLWTTRSRLPQTLHSYSTIVHILARSRLKSQAQTFLRSSLRLFEPDSPNSPPPVFETLVKTYRACDSAPFVFDLLILACLESNRIDNAAAVARALRSRAIFPQVSTCNCFIRSVSRRRGPHCGYDVYREVFGLDSEADKGFRKTRVLPNVHTFNELMLGFYKDNVYDMVEGVWEEMGRYDCVPNVYSYSILMAAYCDEGKVSEAEKLWEEMRVKDLKHDVVAYNTIIGGFCSVGDVARAEEFYREMMLSGIDSTCSTYEHLIDGYCKLKDIDSAMILYKDMTRKGFQPEALTVEAMIGGLCDGRKVSEALQVLNVALDNLNCLPTRNTYKFLIEGFIEQGKIEEALKLQREMVGKGFDPCSKIYTAFIHGYTKEGNTEMTARLRKEMLEMKLPEGE